MGKITANRTLEQVVIAEIGGASTWETVEQDSDIVCCCRETEWPPV